LRSCTRDEPTWGCDFRNTVPRFAPENRKANQVVVDLVAAIAARKSVTPAQLSVRRRV
jgi:aryl-alcohol dehydrogenase-like predicted oxidoreductase